LRSPYSPRAASFARVERWSLHFVYDSSTDGRRFRVLAIVDDFTRQSLTPIPDTSLMPGGPITTACAPTRDTPLGSKWQIRRSVLIVVFPQ
jgi:hypothetical protein